MPVPSAFEIGRQEDQGFKTSPCYIASHPKQVGHPGLSEILLKNKQTHKPNKNHFLSQNFWGTTKVCFKKLEEPGVVVAHAFNPSAAETEAGGSL